MSSIASQLETLAGIKSDIKAAIIDKGQTVGDDFSTYATAIGNIEGGGSSATLITKTATTNGTYRASDDNADGYSDFTVAVPSSSKNEVTLYIRASASQMLGVFNVSELPEFSGSTLPDDYEWGIPSSQKTGNDVIGSVIVV